MNDETTPVRPTRSCIEDLHLKVPTIAEPLGNLDHALIGQAQRLPESYVAGGAERILSLKDRIWFKVKTARWRGAATRLPEADRADAPPAVRSAPWWLGAAGYRREGDPADFYAALTAAADRAAGCTDKWLPSVWDWKRLELERAYAWEAGVRKIVRALVAKSLKDGSAHHAELHNYRVTALARANDGETYLVIGAERVADPKVFAVILNAIPGWIRTVGSPSRTASPASPASNHGRAR